MTDDYTREVLRDALADIERGVKRLRCLTGLEDFSSAKLHLFSGFESLRDALRHMDAEQPKQEC